MQGCPALFQFHRAHLDQGLKALDSPSVTAGRQLLLSKYTQTKLAKLFMEIRIEEQLQLILRLSGKYDLCAMQTLLVMLGS